MIEPIESINGLTPATAVPSGLAAAPHSPALRIAFVHIDSLCWTFFRYHLMVRAKHVGIDFVDRPIQSMAAQIAEIEALLREPLDVLMFRPVSSGHAGLLAVLKRAQALGVHLIAIDGSVGGDLDVTGVGIDNFGGQAGVTEFICQRLNGRGTIAHLQGDQRMEAAQRRTAGLHSVVARYPGIHLAFEMAVDWGSSVPLRTQGERLARLALAEHPQLDAIITTGDENAFGVHDVLLEMGRQDSVLVTGFDALPDALVAIEDGWLEASVHQPLEQMAERALQDALRLGRNGLKGGRWPGPVTHTVLAAETISRGNLVEATLDALRLFPEVIGELEQRKIQQQNSASFLETLIDNLPYMLFVKDAQDLAYVKRNRTADDWIHATPGSMLGKTASDVYSPELATQFNAADREVLRHKLPVDILAEESYLPGIGLRYLHTKKIPILDAFGEPAFLLGLLQDITERRQAELALAEHTHELEIANAALQENREKLIATEKMAALGSLVAGMAHELNTPISNGLLAATSLLDFTRDIVDKYARGLSRSMLENYLADAKNGADILERNLHRAAELINSFKQIAVDQNSSEVRSFELSTLVAEVIMALTPTLKRTPFEVIQSIPAGITMQSYPGPLEQVLINLVKNALIHGLAGRSSGRIGISATLPQPGWVALCVDDNGIGIPDKRLAQIFSPFFTTKSDDGGSGLGLSISHNIVTGVLKGEIEVSSTEGEGSRFAMLLPIDA